MRSILFLLALATAGAAYAGEQGYRLKSQDRRTGSLFLRESAYSRIPFDKTYEQLSPEEKSLLHAAYEHMGPGDEPPFPLKGLKGLFRGLAETAYRFQAAGKLDIRVLVDAEGRPQTATIYATPDIDMARAMGGLMLIEKYKPAKCAGTPCAQEFQLRTRLLLDF